jgi:transposase
VVHGYEQREWRHLDTCQMRTLVRALVPRLRAPDGTTRLAEVPWAGRHGRFTLLFEAWAVRVLQAATTVSAAAGLLGISWDQAHGIMERAVKRGLARRDLSGTWSLAFDEKSFLSGQSYVAVMAETCREDGGKNRVLEVAQGADAEAFGRLWQSLPEEVAGQVEVAAMDMGEAPRKAAAEHAPGAAVVYDRFHVMAQANEAVNAVRRAEHKKLAGEGDELLKGSRQLWLYRPENLPEASFDTFSALVAVNTATSRAWVVKEVLAGFWEQPCRAAASDYIRKWIAKASRSWQEPVKKLAKMVREHLDGLLNWFDYPVSTGPSEGLNSRIQAIKSAARGFRSFDNYRTRILFYLGDLDMGYRPSA